MQYVLLDAKARQKACLIDLGGLGQGSRLQAGLCRAVPGVFWLVKGTSRLKRKQGVNLSVAVETTHGLKLTQGSV